MLSNNRRTQLDNIVQTMLKSKESDSNIQFVVDDFKKKYEFEKQISIEKPKMGITEKVVRTLLPKGVEKFGETLGGAMATKTKEYKEAVESQKALDDMNVKLGEAIISGRKQGKDTLRMEELYQENTGKRLELKDIIGETAEKTTKQIAGEALTTVGTMALGAKPFTTPLKRIGFSGALGTTFGTAQAMREDKSVKNIATSGVIGGIIGLAISGAFEGVSALGKKILPRMGKYTYTKELQPPTKEITKSVEMGFKTFGENVRNLTDDVGKPIYKGTYTTMRKQAINELNQKGSQLMARAKQYDPTIKVSRSEAAKNIITNMQDTFGKLKNSQLNAIKFEVNRMPAEMNVTEMIKNKRLYDGLIPDSFWLKAGDTNVAFNTQVKYILRDNLRKLVNEKTDDPIINKLNNELSIAMDVKHLTSEQIAQRMKQKISGAGGWFYKMVGRFIDDYLFNPAITTRTSQAVLRAGQKVGQTPLRSATRGLIIKGISENQ